MGLTPTVHILTTAIGLLPTACLYIALGLLLGSVLSEKAVGGICGALMTNLAGWLSGTWFSVELIGGAFEEICKKSGIDIPEQGSLIDKVFDCALLYTKIKN